MDEAVHVDERDGNRVAETLSVPLRRRALQVLRDVETPLSLADLAIELVRRESDDRAVDGQWEQVRQYRITLYHAHVPKLAEAGLVEYDADRKTVAPVEGPKAVGAST